MNQGDSDAEKTIEPSQRKLEELRKQGDIARSSELTAAAAVMGFAAVFSIAGATAMTGLGGLAQSFLDQPDRIAPRLLTAPATVVGPLLTKLAILILPIFLLPALLVLGVSFAQRSLHFTPSRLAPRLSRISPFQGFKSRFGREGLVTFARNLAKVIAIAIALNLILWPALPQMFAALGAPAGQSTLTMLDLAKRLLLVAALMALAFGGLDYGWQWFLHRQRAMMTREEAKQEAKEQEGDPHLKQHRRRRAQEIALNKMLTEVAEADVVVVNPTHYAVALKWKRKDRRPPVVVAKGVDDVAARIRERAAQAGVPLFSDPPTARALYATVELGKAIRPDHYKAVAAAIRFAEAMRKRAREAGYGR